MDVYDKIDAVFRPRTTDTLKSNGHQFIGQRGTFEALWEIEPGQTYAGEWAMQIPKEWREAASAGPWDAGFIWVPSGDLEQLVFV